MVVHDNLTGTHSLGALTPGQCETVTPDPTRTVTEEDVCNGSVVNKAYATGIDYCDKTITSDEVSWTVTTDYNASLSITKTAHIPGPIKPGTVITYNITVKNTGDVMLYKVNVTDDLTNFQTQIPSLGPGESESFHPTHTVGGCDVCGPIVNNATANATDTCGNVLEDVDATYVIAILFSSSISVAKEANYGPCPHDPAGPGDTITYTITVTNTGDINVTKVNVTDSLVDLTGPTGDNNGNGWLEPNETWNYTGTHEVTEYDVCGTINNTVTANATDVCGMVLEDVDATWCVPTGFSPVLTVTKTADYGPCPDNPARSGDNITYTINVSNEGDVSLTTVNVTDDRLSLHEEHFADSLDPGAYVTKTFEYTVKWDDMGQNITNTVLANATDPCGGLVSDSDWWCVPTEYGPPAISVVKTASPVSGTPCTNVTFNITVTNEGESPLNPVEVVDTIPAGMSYVSADPVPDSFVENANGTWTVTWANVGPLDPAESTDIVLIAHIDEDVSELASPMGVLGVLSVPDEMLHVLADGGPGEAVQKLEWMKVRLGIGMKKLIELRDGFDKEGAQLTLDHRIVDGVSCTLYSYTDPVSGEYLDLLMVDGESTILSSEYYDPVTDAVLTTEYGFSGIVVSDSYLSKGTMEGLRIDYNEPGMGYKTYTVVDYMTGDTLIVVTDPSGTDISKEYRKTPGIPREKRFIVYNVVNVTGTDPMEETVTDSDDARVEIIYLSDLRLDKTPSETVATVGDIVTYTYVVENNGKTTIDNLNLTDDKLGPIVLNRTILKPGEVATGTANYTVLFEDLPGPLLNNAIVVGTDPLGDVINDTDDALVPLYISEIILIKTADPTEAYVNETITYTYIVENIGNTVITNLNLTDDRLGSIVLNRTTLEPGEATTGVANYTVLFEDLPGPLVNNATVVGVDPLENEVNDTDDAEVVLIDRRGPAVNKTALQKSVRRGDEITYIIEICPPIQWNNVVVHDVFSRDVEFVSADPWPDDKGSNWQNWSLGSIDLGECKNITLVVKAPKMQDFEFDMDHGVSGVGFVKVASDYSTAPPSYVLENCVNVTYNNITGHNKSEPDECEYVAVTDVGTELHTREHGSGEYDTEERIRMLTENKSITMEKDVSATYAPTSLGLYRNRTVYYSSPWAEKACAKNRMTGASISEMYHYATSIDRNSRIELDKNGSTLEVDVTFDGMGHIGVLKKADPNATARDTPIFESSDDYTGSFRVYKKIDEYGSSVKYDSSATGTGFVAGERRIKDSQKSYEYGTGSYESDEIIRTHTNYMAKDISLVYGPSNQSLIAGVDLNQSLKWKEGMWSKVEKTSFIGEEYTYADRLEKETIASGLNQMDTEAEFSGRARYKTFLANSSAGPFEKVMLDLDEVYIGDYGVTRKVHISGISKYDRPHVTVTKVGDFERPGSTILNYTITVLNDGNKMLGDGTTPVFVVDTFPPGTVFVAASARPMVLTSTYVEWDLVSLPVGGEAIIDLKLNMTEYAGELINRVEVTAEVDGKKVTARNFSVLEVDWLSCCPREIFVSKTASVDPVLPNIVSYRLTVQNLADDTMVARVVDDLPEGMTFLGSSVEPESYELGVVTWTLNDIPAGEWVVIEYMAEAQWSGTFVNRAKIEAYSFGGAMIQPVYANAVVVIGKFEAEMSPPPGWRLPEWGFNYTGYPTEMRCEEICGMGE